MTVNIQTRPAKKWMERILLALIFVAIGSLIILVFSPWRPLLEKGADYLGRAALIASLGLAAVLISRQPGMSRYGQITVGLLILACAVTVDWVFSKHLFMVVGVTDAAPRDWALIKLNEAVVVIATIILLTKLTGGSLGSLYLQKGRLKLGLLIGGIAFLVAVAGSVPMATLFKARDLSLSRIIPWIPWLLIYVLCNASLEEVMFRGLFLRKLEPFVGKWASNLLIAFVFTALHGTVTYTADTMIFLAVTFPLAIAWGYVMQKTEGAWGSILFHAGMDIPIMLGIFSNL